MHCFWCTPGARKPGCLSFHIVIAMLIIWFE